MKNIKKIKNMDDVEKELSIILICDKKAKSDISITQIFDFLSESIEYSIQNNLEIQKRTGLNKILGKYKLAKLLSKGSYTKVNQIPGFPPKVDLGDFESAELRLKTAITAFKLHSGPFGYHSVFGELEKKQWEKIHSMLAAFLFGYIDIFGDEKIRFQKDKEYKKESIQAERNENQQRHYNKNQSKEGKQSPPNKKWKNKRKNYNHKGNRNHGGETK